MKIRNMILPINLSNRYNVIDFYLIGDDVITEKRIGFEDLSKCYDWMECNPSKWNGYQIYDKTAEQYVIPLHNLLFRGLQTAKWREVNLESYAKIRSEPKELIDYAAQSGFINRIRDKLYCDYLYGGYMEDRRNLHKGRYLKEDGCIHLGVDYWVPAGTPVYLPVVAELIHSEMDNDQDGGWGGKLIFRTLDTNRKTIYFILGHLDKIVTEKIIYHNLAIDPVGVVGDYNVNGGWHPHLHVQCMYNLDVTVDGYSHYYEGMTDNFQHPNILERILIRQQL